jgi:hypothetical protein
MWLCACVYRSDVILNLLSNKAFIIEEKWSDWGAEIHMVLPQGHSGESLLGFKKTLLSLSKGRSGRL